jgi:ABC-type transport system involved in multi-copper enzyme maturation permease subunit
MTSDAPVFHPGHASPESLLRYRPWRGSLGGPWRGALAVARLSLAGLIRRKLVWVLLAFAALIFLSFFFGQYLLIWAVGQINEEEVRVAGFQRVNPNNLIRDLNKELKLNGSAETFRNLFWYEGSILIVTLAFVGAQIVGNDFRHRSLPFYLSKPLAGRHYIAGKCLAVSAIVLAVTALPAMALFIEYGLLDSWEYFWRSGRLFFGILGYGAVIAVTLSLLLVAVTSTVQKTAPLVMVWSAIFILIPSVAQFLAVETASPNWRLIDLWNCAYVVGNRMLGITLDKQPSTGAASAVLIATCLFSGLILARRVKAVEVV